MGIEITETFISMVEQKMMFETDKISFTKIDAKEVRMILKKQMPIAPRAESNGSVEYSEDWLECPRCGEAVPEYTSEHETECYCVRCGQKLKWDN